MSAEQSTETTEQLTEPSQEAKAAVTHEAKELLAFHLWEADPNKQPNDDGVRYWLEAEMELARQNTTVEQAQSQRSARTSRASRQSRTKAPA